MPEGAQTSAANPPTASSRSPRRAATTYAVATTNARKRSDRDEPMLRPGKPVRGEAGVEVDASVRTDFILPPAHATGKVWWPLARKSLDRPLKSQHHASTVAGQPVNRELATLPLNLLLNLLASPVRGVARPS